MKPPQHRQHQLKAERTQLKEASQRLLAGTPVRSDGALTISGLAREAGIPRYRVYEHHTDIASQFKTAAGRGPLTPNIQGMRHQLDAASDRIRHLEDTNAALRRQVSALAAVITEITHEQHADNIVALPRRHQTNEARPKARD
ncbi:hypothetical protein [Amycolatopsis sp. WAC 04182]|uniref:hypothetical protein n=1 Tax=Amycolatopsis sp. WAC 04182 TaxID=2203198 RepID=UPI000F782059|nr:hypothetical protein [Amycolatopsis sp. WAC 04182]